MTVPHDQPMQPVVRDPDGVIRFQPNAIVRFLLDWATPRGMGLNELAMMTKQFSDDDRAQFAQLIGYSVVGFSELSYVSDETYKRADEMVAALEKKESDDV